MFGRTIMLALGVIGLAYSVSSTDMPEYMPKDSSSGSRDTAANQEWYAGDITLERRSNGHFYADALVDGAAIEMMVDTGASVIALTGDDARTIGLDWDEDAVRHIGSGASGAVYGVPVQLNEVEIGGLARRNVRAVIIPEGLDISLLGQSYLSQMGSVEIAGKRMVIEGS